jgi:type II secretion system protein N
MSFLGGARKIRKPGLFLLTAAGMLLLGLLAGFYLFFPAEALKQRVTQEFITRTGTEVQIQQASLYPPLNLHANQVRIDIKELSRPLEIDELSLSPQWSTLLSRNPGVTLNAQLMGGSVTGGALKSGLINALATDLRFDLPLQKPMAMNITGTLKQANVDAATRLDPKTKTRISLQLSDVRVFGLDLFKADSPGLALGEIILELDGQGRAMKIETLSAKGGDFDVNGGGTLLIGRTSAASRIKLELQIRPGPTADPSIASLLELTGKQTPSGFYSLKVNGTLAKPVLKTGG